MAELEYSAQLEAAQDHVNKALNAAFNDRAKVLMQAAFVHLGIAESLRQASAK